MAASRWLLGVLAAWALILLGLHHDALRPGGQQVEGRARAMVGGAHNRTASESGQTHSQQATSAGKGWMKVSAAPSAKEGPPAAKLAQEGQARGTQGALTAKLIGTSKQVVVVEDGECKYRPPEVIQRCSSLETAYSPYCGGRGFDSHYHHGYIAAFRILAPYMPAAGVERYSAVRMDEEKQLRKSLKSADVVITIAALVPKLSPMTRARFLVVERADAAPVVEDSYYDINSNRILAVLKHTSLHPLTRNNDDPLIHGRHHYVQLDASLASSARKRFPPLSPTALRKVHAMVPQVFRFRFPLECGGKRNYLHLLPALLPPSTAVGNGIASAPTPFLKPLAERSIDIAFLGGTQEHEVLKKHRAKAAAAIQALGSRHPHVRVVAGLKKTKTVGEFYELLRDVKFFVSPYGYGEFANKDYEAILSGCVLVKPLAHQLTAFPNIYKPGVSAVDVKGDFSDLEHKLLPLLGALPKAQRIADTALQKLRKFADPAVPAEHLSHLLHSVT